MANGTTAKRFVLPTLLALALAAAPLAGQSAEGAASGEQAAADSVEALVAEARAAAEDGDHGRAARRYAEAARLAPEIGGWLGLSRLQAAAMAGDTATARAVAAALEDDPSIPADSVALALARSRFRAADPSGGLSAAEAFRAGADPALWTRRVAPALLARGDTAAAREGLLEAARSSGAPPRAGELLLDLGLSPTDRLVLARADRYAGRLSRARRLLGELVQGSDAHLRGRAARLLADLELDAGRLERSHEVAAAGIRSTRAGPERAMLELIAASTHSRRGQTRQALEHYGRGAEAGGGEHSARAAYLAADLAHDMGRMGSARERYRRAAEGFPGTDHGGLARMRLGFLAFSEDDWPGAARQFRAYRDDLPDGDWAVASLYWEARTRAEEGDEVRAASLLRAVLRRDPLSWYGVRAGARLERDPLAAALDRPDSALSVAASPAAGDEPEVEPAVRALLDRMALLRELGWRHRALAEMESAREREGSGWDVGAVALRMSREGWALPGIRLGWSGFARNGGWTLGLVEAVWPLPYREEIERAARRLDLPPALVAGVARQESAFDPGAVSSAGAVGLMQLMPATAAELARQEGERRPGRSELTDPARNLGLGVRYLAQLLDRFPDSGVGVLASYNAGPHRWTRWRDFPEASIDEELLIERIPFRETRLYVKLVLRNAELYARLHGLDADGWGGGLPSAPHRISAGGE